MKTATELLAEMLKIYDEPDKGAGDLHSWLHQNVEEVRGVVEGAWLEGTKRAFTCPECGGHWFGTSGASDKDRSKWVVYCHEQYLSCRWSGPYEKFVNNEHIDDRARGEGE